MTNSDDSWSHVTHKVNHQTCLTIVSAVGLAGTQPNTRPMTNARHQKPNNTKPTTGIHTATKERDGTETGTHTKKILSILRTRHRKHVRMKVSVSQLMRNVCELRMRHLMHSTVVISDDTYATVSHTFTITVSDAAACWWWWCAVTSRAVTSRAARKPSAYLIWIIMKF